MANEYGNQQLQPEHLLYALLNQSEGLIPELVEKCGGNSENLKRQVLLRIKGFPKVSGGQVYLSSELRDVFEKAEKTASNMGDEYTSVEHLLLGIIKKSSSSLKDLLKSENLTEKEVLEVLKDVRGNQRVTTDNPDRKSTRLNSSH